MCTFWLVAHQLYPGTPLQTQKAIQEWYAPASSSTDEEACQPLCLVAAV